MWKNSLQDFYKSCVFFGFMLQCATDIRIIDNNKKAIDSFRKRENKIFNIHHEWEKEFDKISIMNLWSFFYPSGICDENILYVKY